MMKLNIMTNKSLSTFFKSIALGVLLISLLSACTDDFFDAKIGDKVLPGQHYNDASDVWSSFNGIVLLLQEIMPNHIILDGLLSDQMQPTASAEAELVTLYTHSFSSGNSFIKGSPYYKVIVSANDVLANVDAVVEKDYLNYDSITNASVKRALITYRSWAYFNYVRLYGSATILPVKFESVDDVANMEVVDMQSMFQRLIDDLTPVLHDINAVQAEMLIPNAINTRALLGEIYLEMNNYIMAEKYLREACESFGRVLYKVDRTYQRESFKSIFINPAGAQREVMVSVPFSFEDGQKNPLETFFRPDFDFKIEPTGKLVKSFREQIQLNDTIGDQFRGIGVSFDRIPWLENRFFISKYSLEPGAVPYSADIIIYRTGDIHLLLAEAYNRLGESKIALTLMNEGLRQLSGRPQNLRTWNVNEGIRGRVSLKPRQVPDSISDKTSFIENLILEERALELAFEGKRWFDLMRVARRRNDPAFLANMVASKFPDPAVAERVRQRLMAEGNWFLPAF
jgi:starch-binding outer membrane protein, SusD/RagB family